MLDTETLVPTSTLTVFYPFRAGFKKDWIVLPQISSEFRQFNQAGWLGTSCVDLTLRFKHFPSTFSRYLLSTCTFTPLYGRLCNVMGRRGASQVALLFACSGVLMSGLSNSMEMLIASRFVCRFTHRNFTLISRSTDRRYRWWWPLYHCLVGHSCFIFPGKYSA